MAVLCVFSSFFGASGISLSFLDTAKFFFSSEFVDVDAGQQQELLSFFAGNTEKSF